ncbi:hypothetical protein NPIL_298941, partial [Nephila pilipes]
FYYIYLYYFVIIRQFKYDERQKLTKKNIEK